MKEVQKARYKDFCRFRKKHTHKMIKLDINFNLLIILLISSDAVINNFQQKSKKKLSLLSQEFRNLLYKIYYLLYIYYIKKI